MTYIVTERRREALRAALTSPDLILVTGKGNASVPGQGRACTISEIVLTLTGELDDGPHPCISEVIRRWVIPIQDVMPDNIRNSNQWREAAIGIAGSASTEAVENRRHDFLLAWVWDALGDEAVLASIDAREPDVREACADEAICVAYVGDAATYVADVDAYWSRRNLPATLAALIAITEGN